MCKQSGRLCCSPADTSVAAPSTTTVSTPSDTNVPVPKKNSSAKQLPQIMKGLLALQKPESYTTQHGFGSTLPGMSYWPDNILLLHVNSTKMSKL